MDFDFNWILVPATFIFFAIWLLDKFVLKQYANLKQKKKQALQADQNVQQAQIKFDQLKSKYPELVITDTVSQPDEPEEVTRERDCLSQAKVDSAKAYNALKEHKISSLVNWAYDIWPVLAVVLVVRSFLYEPFNIPSESMNPTLETGDFILVNKYAFGMRLPLVNTKIIDSGSPKHGDVAVFRYPENPRISFIKRIIGLPGDHIAFKNGELYINGNKQSYHLGNQVMLPVQYKDQIGQSQSIDMQAEQWVTNLGTHQFISQYILPAQSNPVAQQFVQNYAAGPKLSLQQNWEVTIPEGQYFAMGDNRDQSEDSRYWGFVPEENLTGKAIYIWMHKAPGLHIPTFDRNGRIP